MPVDKMTGLSVLITLSIKSQSISSKDAILYAGTFNDSRKSTAVSSNGELKIVMPSCFANSNSGACHSNGVCASAFHFPDTVFVPLDSSALELHFHL